MPIGDSYHLVARNKINKFLLKRLGMFDLHTHIRVGALIKFFEDCIRSRRYSEMKVLELGCGTGINAFELAKVSKKCHTKLKYTGVDINREGIKKANQVLRCHKLTAKITFFNEDARVFLKNHEDLTINCILLMDIIEHIEDVRDALDLADRHLQKGGIYIVSTPTPLYPKVFGRKFHEKIGHVVDGYSLEALDRLFVKHLNCRRLMYKYNTGLLCSIGCWLYHLFDFDNKYFNILKSLILYPFKFLDFYNSPQISCTLFAVYKKER